MNVRTTRDGARSGASNVMASDEARRRDAGEKGQEGKEGEKEKRDEKTTRDEGKGPVTPSERHTLFFGQMPFDTKASDIMPWLKADI